MADLFVCGGMLDGLNNNLVEHVAILCDQGIIKKIYQKQELDKIKQISAHRINASDFTAIPGLIDSHVHLAGNITEQVLFGDDDPSFAVVEAIKNSQSVVSGGITTVRDCGAPGRSMMAMRTAVRNGIVDGPDIFTSGPPITAKGGHLPNISIVIEGEQEARKAVHTLSEMNVDFIKTMVTGGGGTPGTNIFISHFSQSELTVLCDEAHALGLKVSAHLHGTEGIRMAVAAGIDFLEHTSWLKPGKIELDGKMLKKIIERDTCVSITIGVLNRRPISKLRPELEIVWNDYRKKFLGIVKEMREQGVKLAVGTDSGTQNTPLDVPYYAIEDLVFGAGYSIVDALHALTSTNAQNLGYIDRGVLSEGKRADIAFIKGNPLLDINSFRRVMMTVVHGKIVYEYKDPGQKTINPEKS